jgi:hypothetical protein
MVRPTLAALLALFALCADAAVAQFQSRRASAIGP